MRVLILISFCALVSACGGPPASPTSNQPNGELPPERGGIQETAEPSPRPRPPPLCPARPACDAPLTLGAARPFRHLSSKLTAASGSPNHRGRDLFLRPGATPWAMAKFAYGRLDKDLHDEEVDVYLLRSCEGDWSHVGTYRTSEDGEHPAVQGVEDTGGRIYVNLASLGPFDVGLHRVRMVVAGDHSSADLFIEVLADNARIVVSDIDGTLTMSETEAWAEVAAGVPSDANPGAPEALHALVDRGFSVFYLTARPEWLDRQTRSWLALRGFPRGVVHTSLNTLPQGGQHATDFKTRELADLNTATGLVPEVGFGNSHTDLTAYARAGVPPEGAYYFKLEVPAAYGTHHEDYRGLLPRFESLPARCP